MVYKKARFSLISSSGTYFVVIVVIRQCGLGVAEVHGGECVLWRPGNP